MPQLFFGLLALFAQIVVTEGSTNGYRKVSNVIHFNAIGGALRNYCRHGFRLHRACQEDAGNPPVTQMEDFQRVRSLPVQCWVFSEHHVIVFRLQASSKLLRSQNYVCADLKMRPPERLRAMLYMRGITMNKQDSQGQPSACPSVHNQWQVDLLDVSS